MMMTSQLSGFPGINFGVVGSGTMGRGIAQWAAQAGHAVQLYDISEEALRKAIALVREDLEKRVSRGKLAAEDRDAIIGRITPVTSLTDLAPCHLVVEAIVEDLAVKAKLFAELEGIVPASCILATNTSSLSVAALASSCERPERVAGLHFFNPVPAMRLVEVIKSPSTKDDVITFLLDLCKHGGHSPVVARDMPGFIVNHAGRAFGPEALRILSEQTTDAATVDAIIKEGAGFRMGPLELFDLIGLDVSLKVMNSIYNQFLQEPRFRPSAIAAQRVAAGLYGRKSGAGFYDYRNPSGARIEPARKECDVPVWISNVEPALAQALRSMLADAGVTLDTSDKPEAGSLILVTPLGSDATTAAITQQLDPTRTVAVDMLFSNARRLTIMGSPVISPRYLDCAAAAIEATGRSVSVINDSAGFVAQRIVAQIVSIGSDIAQQGIAAPEDVDLAVRLGLGYPMGPLELGDQVGRANIIKVLDGLFAFYGDPCYRASVWLRRRAMLNVSLLTN